VIDAGDGILPPITGSGSYNHLSVRSAAAIILDRLPGTNAARKETVRGRTPVCRNVS
ncbi:MAG: hypothetical protein JRD39_03975, partial [Deltaproteobacteria bacterium]|nr:hypothetical protein [Deltaproteobacteria bacterium]